MALFLYEKDDVLRHLGYEVQGLYQQSAAGGSAAFGNMGHRFFRADGSLLFRLGQLAPTEECRVAGRAYGSIGFSGFTTQPGDTVTVTISGGGLVSPIAKTFTVPTSPNPYPLVNVCANLAQLFSQSAAFVNSGFLAVADYGSQPFTQSKQMLPVVSFIAPYTADTFNIAVGFTGLTAPQILAQGRKLPPFLNLRQQGTVNTIWGYLPILDFLEAQKLGSTGQMTVSKTDNVTFRADEFEQRDEQYTEYCQKFASWLGVPLGPGHRGGGGPMQVVT
jgi:hypothetical protein